MTSESWIQGYQDGYQRRDFNEAGYESTDYAAGYEAGRKETIPPATAESWEFPWQRR